LINAAKHAWAKAVKINLCWSNDKVEITVEDDGTGFNPDHLDITQVGHPTGFGLFSIRERLIHFGGSLDIQSCKGKGTRITLSVPLEGKNPGKRSVEL
jgi:signal transduction histidine kinase